MGNCESGDYSGCDDDGSIIDFPSWFLPVVITILIAVPCCYIICCVYLLTRESKRNKKMVAPPPPPHWNDITNEESMISERETLAQTAANKVYEATLAEELKRNPQNHDEALLKAKAASDSEYTTVLRQTQWRQQFQRVPYQAYLLQQQQIQIQQQIHQHPMQQLPSQQQQQPQQQQQQQQL